ncbi:MAG: hypothetical protein K8S24_01880 [Candidatus Aegiribacteria sp.]|nr:hypothetical protein [Candidatus Aegiribacteria sp.]
MRTAVFTLIPALLFAGMLEAADLPDFSGTWETTYGTLFLQQDNSHVSGYYTLDGYSTIKGEIGHGGKLIFTYREPTASGEGWFELSNDSMSISGMWRPDGGGQWYEWEGYRAGAGITPSNWLVILESEWQSSLSEEEYSFGEMLEAWFARVSGVNVRHRFIHDVDDLAAFCLESSGLPGDLYLVIASHGSASGIELSSGTVPSREFVDAIRPCSNLVMIHFSCCEIMSGRMPQAIISSRNSWPADFVVSGYSRSVDWGASGLIEIFYFNQMLDNGFSPPDAANSVIEDIDFAGQSSTRWMDAAGFSWIQAE